MVFFPPTQGCSPSVSLAGCRASFLFCWPTPWRTASLLRPFFARSFSHLPSAPALADDILLRAPPPEFFFSDLQVAVSGYPGSPNRPSPRRPCRAGGPLLSIFLPTFLSKRPSERPSAFLALSILRVFPIFPHFSVCFSRTLLPFFSSWNVISFFGFRPPFPANPYGYLPSPS